MFKQTTEEQAVAAWLAVSKKLSLSAKFIFTSTIVWLYKRQCGLLDLKSLFCSHREKTGKVYRQYN